MLGTRKVSGAAVDNFVPFCKKTGDRAEASFKMERAT
jgi:hypothetical protein